MGKYHESPRTSVSATEERKITTMSGLLGVGVEMYNNSSDGVSRYSHFVEDIFNLPTNSIVPEKAQPMIELPANKDEIYKEVATRCGIDTSKPQISISVEASVLGKRYDMRHWVEVILLLKKSHPDYTFNIIHKPDSNIDGFKTEDIQNALNEGGVLGDCHLVSGNLTEMAVLMEKQKLVLSNDTGLAHIAGALKNGPPVLTLFSPRGAPEPKFWISNQKKQRAVTLPPSAVLDFPDGYDVYRGDQANRPIDRIPPQTVANVALEKLSAA